MLLLFFKMDNGSNVCGVEFNYNNNNKKEKKTENKDLKSMVSTNESEHEDLKSITSANKSENEDLKSITSANESENEDSKSITSANESEKKNVNDYDIFCCSSGFKVVSEEGRSVDHFQQQVFPLPRIHSEGFFFPKFPLYWSVRKLKFQNCSSLGPKSLFKTITKITR